MALTYLRVVQLISSDNATFLYYNYHQNIYVDGADQRGLPVDMVNDTGPPTVSLNVLKFWSNQMQL